MNRRRAVTSRRTLPAVLLLVVGVLLAVGVPTVWALTHQDPALTPIGQGVAVSLAQSGAGELDPGAAPVGSATASAGTARSTPTSATLTAVPTVTSPMPTTMSSSGTPVLRPSTGTTPAPSIVRSSPRRFPARSSAPASKPRPPTASKSTAAAPTRVVPPPQQPPARLRIPAIGVDAPVGPVGLDDRGEMAVPQLVQDIGWYEYGPAPGATAGSAVLSGHVDSAQQGLGAFARLGELAAGDRITVTDRSGRLWTYRVVGKEAFDKKTVPLADLFSRTGAARLTLITCGGAFDSVARSYLDNIVITAVPA